MCDALNTVDNATKEMLHINYNGNAARQNCFMKRLEKFMPVCYGNRDLKFAINDILPFFFIILFLDSWKRRVALLTQSSPRSWLTRATMPKSD